MSYQWYLNGAALNVANSANVLELDNVTTTNGGTYRVVVSNAVGSVSSAFAGLAILENGSLTPPQMWLLNHDAAGGDGIQIALEAGRNYRVQSSPDTVNWTDFTNFLSSSSLITFTNSLFSNQPALFYRVVTP